MYVPRVAIKPPLSISPFRCSSSSNSRKRRRRRKRKRKKREITPEKPAHARTMFADPCGNHARKHCARAGSTRELYSHMYDFPAGILSGRPRLVSIKGPCGTAYQYQCQRGHKNHGNSPSRECRSRDLSRATKLVRASDPAAPIMFHATVRVQRS